MAEEDFNLLLNDVFKHYNTSKELISQFKSNSRLFIAKLEDLIDHLKNGKPEKAQLQEIEQIIGEKPEFANNIYSVKNQLEDIKNKLEQLELSQSQLIRANRGRQNSIRTAADSGIGSITSRLLSCCQEPESMTLTQQDSRPEFSPVVQEQTPHAANRDGVENEDKSNTDV